MSWPQGRPRQHPAAISACRANRPGAPMRAPSVHPGQAAPAACRLPPAACRLPPAPIPWTRAEIPAPSPDPAARSRAAPASPEDRSGHRQFPGLAPAVAGLDRSRHVTRQEQGEGERGRVAGWRPPASQSRIGRARRQCRRAAAPPRGTRHAACGGTWSAAHGNGASPRRIGYGFTASPSHQRRSGPKTKIAKCRCGASADALPVAPT